MPLRQPQRLWQIRQVLLRHGLDEFATHIHLRRPLRLLLGRPRTPPPGSLPQRLRLALQELGPIFIKFGQQLSTRRDLLPLEYADELAKLQDQVPPLAGADIRLRLEKLYRQPLATLFAHFEPEAFAAASIAQVHGARLPDGREVVVKVLRPGIEVRIRQDVALLYSLARLTERYWPESRRLRPKEVVAEFEKTLLDELDLMREAANAAQLRRNFLHSPVLYIPEVIWPLCRREVLVSERIYGIPVSQITQIQAAGIDLRRLAETGVEIFFTQVFRDNFFHADMHPGNIFVSQDGRYLSVDFGIMGTLSPSDQRYLAENLLAFFNRDYRRVAELHVESGWVPSSTRVDEFEAAIRSVCEPVFQRPLKEISFGLFLLNLFQAARRFDMVIQPQLVLLQKTLLNIEGLGRQLYPDLDLWQTAKPYLEQWMLSQVGPQAFWRHIRAELPRYGEFLPALPRLSHQVLSQAARGELGVQLAPQQWQQWLKHQRRQNQRLEASVLAAACLIAAALLAPASWQSQGLPTFLLTGLAGLIWWRGQR